MSSARDLSNFIQQQDPHLVRIRDQALADKHHLLAANPTWDDRRDGRVVLMNKFINTLNTCILSWTFAADYLLDGNWWDERYPHVPVTDRQIYRYEFWVSTRWTFIIALFSCFDSSFRVFLRHFDPSAESGRPISFVRVWKALRGHLAGRYVKTSRSLDFLRMVRNTVHNNNVFIDPEGKNRQITYRGRRYRFRDGRPIRFVTWEVLLDLTDDLRRLTMLILTDRKLRAVTSPMKDPIFP